MKLHWQGGHYLAFGVLQWLLDWGVMIGLTHLGMPIEPANIIGRITGAALGFWLNGAITFASKESALGPTQFSRFALLWLLNTAVSTWALGSIDHWFGLGWAWLAKPAIEVALGLCSFLLCRHWVYKG